MGKKLIFIVVFLTLIGCTTKRYKANDVYEKKVLQEEVLKNKSYTTYDYKHILDSLFSVTTFTFDIYDTEHPDTVGNYPIKMHGKSVTKTTNIGITEETHADSTIECDTIIHNENCEKVEHSVTETATRNRTFDIICLFVFGSFFIVFYKLNNED